MTDKVILVIDKPKTCLDCPVCTLDEMDGDYICGKTGKCVEEYFDKKPNWCSLIPLPKEMERTENEDTISLSFRNGWNSYYFEITGGEEE